MEKIKYKFLLTVFILILLFTSKIYAQWNQPQWVVDKYEPLTTKFRNVDNALAYRLLRPLNFDASKKYPVVITLHGTSGFNKVTANDYNINNIRYINQELAKDSIRLAHPTYVVCLQGIKNTDGTVDLWDSGYLRSAKEIIAALPNVDTEKIYVVGQSAGGYGTNKFISLDPSYFAAAISVSAQGGKDITATDRDKLVNFNLWTMHGDADGVMQYSFDVELFNYMKSKNAKMKFTTYLGEGHGTEPNIVGSYGTSGTEVLKVFDTDTGQTNKKVFNYTTQYAGTSSDIEPNTLDWLFSKSLLTDLPSNNFSIEVIGETCPNSKNGKINITANKDLVYSASVNGQQYSFEQLKLNLVNLAPATYDVCINVVGTSISQCYLVVVPASSTITAKTVVTSDKLQVAIQSGTAPYQVMVNGKLQFETNDTNFDVVVAPGDLLEFTTAKVCEGVLMEKISLSEVITASPNPSSGKFDIYLSTNDSEVGITIYTIDGKLVSRANYLIEKHTVHLNIEKEPAGIYLVRVDSSPRDTIKIIKK